MKRVKKILIFAMHLNEAQAPSHQWSKTKYYLCATVREPKTTTSSKANKNPSSPL